MPEMFEEVNPAAEWEFYEAELARVRNDLSAFRGLNVWVSDIPDASADELGSLFLVEDFPGADSNHYQTMSAYSAMVVLFGE
jgi:hypothetical protein